MVGAVIEVKTSTDTDVMWDSERDERKFTMEQCNVYIEYFHPSTGSDNTHFQAFRYAYSDHL